MGHYAIMIMKQTRQSVENLYNMWWHEIFFGSCTFSIRPNACLINLQ